MLATGSCTTTGSTTSTKHEATPGPRLPGGCESPATQNPGKFGCYFDSAVEIGSLSGPAYYHVDEFPDAESAEQARTPGSAVVRAYDRVFLETVNTDASWRPAGGTRLAKVGPMTTPQGVPVTARFMQAMTNPGAATRPHRHDGPEAFYILSGSICMETPDGAATTGVGRTYWIRGGVPMQLTSAGAEVRRSLFVVVHPTSRPWMTMATDWEPVGACAGQPSIASDVGVPPQSIGSASMTPSGTIVLMLRAESGTTVGDAVFEYPPGHPRYQEVLDHLGGLRPGESKLVPPWPSED